MDKHRPIHERVKDHVDDAGLGYAELAEKTGWSEQKVYRLLHGKTHFRADDIEKLAQILGKSVIALYRGKKAS